MTQAWTWPILPQGQIGSYICLNGENFYKVINWEKLAVNDQFDRKFMFLTKKMFPGGCLPLPLDYIHIYDHYFKHLLWKHCVLAHLSL